jgi:hypothetical protein
MDPITLVALIGKVGGGLLILGAILRAVREMRYSD